MEVYPGILEFKGPFTKPSTEKLVLTNTSAETLAFKVKTTAPKLYCVRPNASVIQPGDSLEVSIISQGLKEEPAPDYKCKDKFLLVTLPCPYDDAETKVAELWPSLESEFKSTSKKIKVNYVIEQSSSGSYASTGVSKAAAVAAAAAAPITSSTREKVDNGAVDTSFATTNEQEVAAPSYDEKSTTISEPSSQVKASSTTSSVSVPASKGGIPIPLAIVLAILAFVIGKYFL